MRPHVVLLVDDQPVVGETLRAMLKDADDIELHVCTDPSKAMATAVEVNATVILQDLVMPGVSGMMLVKFFRRNAKTRDIPIVVLSSTEEARTKAEAFSCGAHDYIVKLPDPIEMLARIRHHSAGFRAELERKRAFTELEETRAHLLDELARANRYARRILPEPLRGDITTEAILEPCEDLGGDMYGHLFLSDGSFAFYVLDVVGHGVGAALHGVSVATVLRAQALSGCDFRRPSEVLSALNRAFPMADHDNFYFTLFYGVYSPQSRTLAFSSAAHPPALLVDQQRRITELGAEGTMIGVSSDAIFEERTIDLPRRCDLFVFSDGAYEIELPGGGMWSERAFQDALVRRTGKLSEFFEQCKALRDGRKLEDDLTVLRVSFS